MSIAQRYWKMCKKTSSLLSMDCVGPGLATQEKVLGCSDSKARSVTRFSRYEWKYELEVRMSGGSPIRTENIPL